MAPGPGRRAAQWPRLADRAAPARAAAHSGARGAVRGQHRPRRARARAVAGCSGHAPGCRSWRHRRVASHRPPTAGLPVKRVLLVSATAKRGGAERVLASLARRLPATGWRPRTVLLEAGPLEEWLAGEDVIHAGDPGVVAELARQADVVLANKWRSQLVAGPAAAAAARPCVWWQHDFPEASPPELLAGSSPVAAVVCGSDAMLAAQRSAAP